MANWLDEYYEVPFVKTMPPVGILNTAAFDKFVGSVKELPLGTPHTVSGKAKGSIPIKTVRFYVEGDDG